ncbi:ABC transporter ATP-binding protein [Halosolutus gelatinilyticus]|uniref:ABC transporter ATP-binding protein n=1 Tax=Halosolutus gelatinilyticus TaxID=2931975 RepID=UPI001FF140A5|nr:ABC transporter ATP-binding protein [Halosolutus gelatinilyticus]
MSKNVRLESTRTSDDVIFELRDVSVTFDMDRGTSRVLDNVEFDVERGEILGVVGESGSGKSMFASAMLDAVVDPGVLSGDVVYHPENGEPIDVLGLSDEELRQFRWEEVSMVFQGAMNSFNPTKKIRNHFVETLKAHGYDVEEGIEHARDLIADLFMEPDNVMDSYPHELSGGMKQRALIALSMVLDPEVLVMDEPTAALDLLMQRSIIRLMEKIQRKYDITIVFITHDLPLVAELADRLAVMYAFEFVESGPTQEILTNPAHPYTRSLLNATPNIKAPVDEMKPIEGSAPDPVNVPEGCSYHPRCPMADETCVSVDPGYYGIDADHRAKCHHWEQSAEAVPLQGIRERIEDADESTYDVIAADEDSTPVVTLDDVEVHFEDADGGIIADLFGDPDIVRAVDGISLDIYENEVVALVGESGCGKTTLGKTAIGLQRPTGGSVKYRGQDVWDAKDRRGDVDVPHGEIRKALQIIHQDPGSALNPNRTIMHSLTMPLKQWNPDLDMADRQARILGMLERVGMSPPEDYAQRYPHQLSGGEKQRVALIRALLMEPDLILGDEAISALDVSLRVEMMDLMLELQEIFDTAFLFISHDFSNARYITEKAGGRIGVMYLGEIVEMGPVDQIVNDPKHPYTKSLVWATPDLETDKGDEEMPIRDIDIPNPKNPPSGCRFHTRCPEAREVCSRETPEPTSSDGDEIHQAACFREYDNHEYWSSPAITGDDGSTAGEAGAGAHATGQSDD